MLNLSINYYPYHYYYYYYYLLLLLLLLLSLLFITNKGNEGNGRLQAGYFK